jgi:hypothetical protein
VLIIQCSLPFDEIIYKDLARKTFGYPSTPSKNLFCFAVLVQSRGTQDPLTQQSFHQIMIAGNFSREKGKCGKQHYTSAKSGKKADFIPELKEARHCRHKISQIS